MRTDLDPIADLADRTGIGILGLIHVNKGVTTDLLNPIMASRAFAAVAPAVACPIVDRDHPSDRLLAVPNNNLGRDSVPSLRYAIKTVDVGRPASGRPVHAPRFVWAEEDTRSVADVLGDNAQPARTPTAATAAASHCPRARPAGPHPACGGVPRMTQSPPTPATGAPQLADRAGEGACHPGAHTDVDSRRSVISLPAERLARRPGCTGSTRRSLACVPLERRRSR